MNLYKVIFWIEDSQWIFLVGARTSSSALILAEAHFEGLEGLKKEAFCVTQIPDCMVEDGAAKVLDQIL